MWGRLVKIFLVLMEGAGGREGVEVEGEVGGGDALDVGVDNMARDLGRRIKRPRQDTSQTPQTRQAASTQ